ncbi:MAG TPA: hypothetical protein VMG08_09790 [Allosphingosinicella sp.]|nr:hypothetical protein [Allosphingosinicella sp.]
MADNSEVDAGSSTASGAIDRFRDWTAIADFQPIVSETPLRVAGEYFLNRRWGSVSLAVKVPQGFNPSILLLDLVEGPGNGGDWVAVEGRFAAARGQYGSVTVIDPDGESVSIPVEEVE